MGRRTQAHWLRWQDVDFETLSRTVLDEQLNWVVAGHEHLIVLIEELSESLVQRNLCPSANQFGFAE